ncbi:TIR domain-containing protein [Chloroflexota bacterium]
MKLFISYARQDQDRVRRLADLLQAAGHEVWFDEALLPGQAWQEELAVAIRNNDAFVYMLSPAAVESDWCSWEFATAVEMSRPIVPVLLDVDLDLPDPLGRYQCADFTAPPDTAEYATATARLIGGLQQIAVVIPREDAPKVAKPAGMPTRSGFIEKVAYDPAQQTMAVEFKDGKIYRYLDVPVKVYREFMKAHALGAYFHAHIKDVYRYHRDDRL